jgi:hypothetical protein
VIVDDRMMKRPGVSRRLANRAPPMRYMPSYPVVAAPNPLEARFFALGINRQRCLHGFPEQWLARELLCRRVNLPYLHRSPDLFEHAYHGLEHWAHPGQNRPGLTRIGRGPTEQLVVERAEPRELNPGSRV